MPDSPFDFPLIIANLKLITSNLKCESQISGPQNEKFSPIDTLALQIS